MAEPEVFSHEPQELDIPETTGSGSGSKIANSAGWTIGVCLEYPAQIGSFRHFPLFQKIELFHSHTTTQGARTHPQILVVIVSPNIPVPVLVPEI